MLLVLVKILLFFVFAAAVAFLANRFFRWMIHQAAGKNLRRYPVLAFVLCLLMAYCAEEFFGVADIIGAFVAGLVVASTPKAKYIEVKFTTLSYMLLTPVFFASIGINVQLPELSGSLAVFSLLLLTAAILSKILGCGLGARLCGFRNDECLQVGAGMACRGEVALIVANRGLSMGVLDQALMTPVIITVVGCAILTPVLLKLVFRGKAESGLQENSLADRYREAEQLEYASEQLLRQNRELMKKKENK